MSEPWAKVPESLADAGLDATAMRVFVIMASKAGRSREAWPSHRAIAERLGLARRTVGHAIRRLERKGLVRDTRKKVPVGEPPVWVLKYEVAPYLHEGHPGRPLGLGQEDPTVTGRDPTVTGRGTNGHPGLPQSSAPEAVPLEAVELPPETEHHEGNPWCRCPDCCWKPEEQEPRQEKEPEPQRAIEGVVPGEEVQARG